MKIIPWTYSFEFWLKLSKESVVNQLKEKVLIYKPFRFSRTDKPFLGRMDDFGFYIWKAVSYPWGSYPRFRGSIIESENGVLIKVEASDEFATFGTFCCWAWCMVSFGVSALCLKSGDLKTSIIAFVSGILALCCSILFTIVYWLRVGSGKDLLLNILRGEVKRGK
jgi:hypothetical protein